MHVLQSAVPSAPARRSISVVAATLLLAGAFVLGNSAISQAGSYEELEQTAALGVGGAITVHRSPTNQGAAMEMDYTDWVTRVGGGSYRVGINSNTTGRPLNIKLLGVNGVVLAQCSTAANSTCVSPAVSLVSNLQFGIVVSTGNGLPVNSGAHYSLFVQRTA